MLDVTLKVTVEDGPPHHGSKLAPILDGVLGLRNTSSKTATIPEGLTGMISITGVEDADGYLKLHQSLWVRMDDYTALNVGNGYELSVGGKD